MSGWQVEGLLGGGTTAVDRCRCHALSALAMMTASCGPPAGSVLQTTDPETKIVGGASPARRGATPGDVEVRAIGRRGRDRTLGVRLLDPTGRRVPAGARAWRWHGPDSPRRPRRRLPVARSAATARA